MEYCSSSGASYRRYPTRNSTLRRTFNEFITSASCDLETESLAAGTGDASDSVRFPARLMAVDLLDALPSVSDRMEEWRLLFREYTEGCDRKSFSNASQLSLSSSSPDCEREYAE